MWGGSITLFEQRMVEIFIALVGIYSTSENVKIHDTHACSNNILENDPDGKPRVEKWNYRAIFVYLSYYNAVVRPDITMATQQCVRFCNSPSRYHEESAKLIRRYILINKDKGLVLWPYKQRDLECYVDTDW